MVKDYLFRYGSSELSIPIDDTQVIGVIEGNRTETLSDIKEELFRALDNPIGTEPLSVIASSAGRIAIVISDMTRFWMRQDLFVPGIISYLVDKCGKNYEDLEIIVATGTHEGGSEEDLMKLVTPDVFRKVKTVNHDCRALDLAYLGTTSYKTPVYVNKDAADADLVICLGAATYHVMAGYGKG